ncbi:cation:proton antiporter [Flexithrix dorotheae]|uniref:cation:proton antiporter n=1 Tax=Flexithrix dorotheae TaxID=70993 RepID=UPI000371C6B7|nr:sodium:proton antiporter [Flexithrix dorotheae]
MIELAALLVLGLLAQWLAWRIKVPAILPLIIIGLLVGPIWSIISYDGKKFIDGDNIFQGEFLFDVISISVGLILFEGGLTLKLKEVNSLGKTVRNLIIVGTIVTLFGGAMVAHYVLGMSMRFAFLFGSLIIVTGPTVIGPILRNVKPNFRINTVLKWESILIDPIGALIAILIYEFIVSGKPGEQFTIFALKSFLITILAGVFVGGAFAFILHYVLTRNLIPKYLRNVVVLAMVIMTFALSDVIHAESGLLAVTLLGMILANLKIENLKEILSFKEDIVLILISFLFVLLSSRIQAEDLITIINPSSFILFSVVVFVLRPVSVFLSTIKSELSLKEKLFISWISPRGIVSAGVASIFAIRLVPILDGNPGSMMEIFHAKLLLPLTFFIIVGTVVLQGITAKPLAKLLGVTRSEPNGVLFLGASEPARFIAQFLTRLNVPVLLADTSQSNIYEAQKLDLPTFEGSLASDDVYEEIDLSQFGQLHAMTSNTEINMMSCKIFSEEFGNQRVYRLGSNEETKDNKTKRTKNLLFNGAVDYINVTHYFRQNPTIQQYDVTSQSELNDFIEDLGDSIIPLFLLKDFRKVEPVNNQIINMGQESNIFYYILKDEEPITQTESNHAVS